MTDPTCGIGGIPARAIDEFKGRDERRPRRSGAHV